MPPSETLLAAATARAGGTCELCDAIPATHVHAVAGGDPTQPDHAVLLCQACADAIAEPSPNDPRWSCLQRAAWSEVPGVQVLAWRLLHTLPSASWARELLDQLYLEEAVLTWAQAGLPAEEDATPAATVDSHGTRLTDGDAVTLIKDLDVKGGGFTAKRGTVVKSIRLTEDPGLIEGRVNGVAIVLKTEFLKRVG